MSKAVQAYNRLHAKCSENLLASKASTRMHDMAQIDAETKIGVREVAGGAGGQRVNNGSSLNSHHKKK